MQNIRDLKIIRLNDKNRLLAGIAATALLAGLGGILIGRTMGNDVQPVAAQPAEEGEKEEDSGMGDLHGEWWPICDGCLHINVRQPY